MTIKLTQQAISYMAQLRALGYNNTEIANKLGVTPETVSYHFNKIKREAEVHGENEALAKVLVGLGGAALGALLGYMLARNLK